MEDGIDFVVLWVDNNDPKWRQEKAKYDQLGRSTEDNDDSRFRDWENMRYWFRAVDKFAPWVRKIHFVTYGHLPNFLDLSNPKINVVRHDEIMPEKDLPTFNSTAIEVNINKIKGLAEKFVYFNDDMFLLRPVNKATFFKGGLPCGQGLEEAIIPTGDGAAYPHHLLNCVDIINRYFNKKEQHRKFRSKYFNTVYGIQNLRNITLSIWKNYTGFHDTHVARPFLKSIWDEVWEKEGQALSESAGHRFRTKDDLCQSLFYYWQIATGNFYPSKPIGQIFTIGETDISVIVETIEKQKMDVVCLNDSSSIKNFELLKGQINNAFQKILPEKSAFEK
ncbi:stealth conserved region 3 domain-containing protein [Limosilactobacillus gorillae]|uniref:stealth conserved region 3 domain-containing protein n=1 Tax=Limosilactobacillus gorillae TaxID=1450649 RepID=UPI000B2BEC88|nr:stealth conserved region 3 domain-containing protein [Limosilactobacillus gorillae]